MSKIEIDIEDGSLLLETYRKKMEERKAAIDILHAEIGELATKFERISSMINEASKQKSAILSDGYSDKFTWFKKIKFVIGKYGPMSSGNIVDTIIKYYEPTLNRKSAIGSVSAVLSVNSGDGREYKRIEGDGGDFIYTFNENENKEPIKSDSIDSKAGENSYAMSA